MTEKVIHPHTFDYPIEWRESKDKELIPYYLDWATNTFTKALWAPQRGSQCAFLNVPTNHVFEVLYEGTRGPGKTDSLLMDFVQYVGRGWGAEWRGILFRQTFPQLTDLIQKTQKWFPQFFPKAKYNKSSHTWTFPDGEQLILSYMNNAEEDYWRYHGHAYPWIGWEELCTWALPNCYIVMMSCCRSSKPGMPRCYRSTTNPYGPGHNWVKSRFRLPHWRSRVIKDSYKNGELEPPRMAIHGSIKENKILLHADPTYIQKIRASARNKSELAAWIDGSWDIIAGGMFDDIWDGNIHIIPSPPLTKIPKEWKIDRAFDWGSSAPFAVGWYAESNGEPFYWNGREYGSIKGDLYQIQEWYGWDGTNRNQGLRLLAKDVAEGIRDREQDWGIAHRCKPGPADSSIFDTENGNCIAEDFKKAGVNWLPADKGPGSRKQGWEQIRKMLKQAIVNPHAGTREFPGLFIFDNCLQTIETMPAVPRDDKDLDDVDTSAEDHLADQLRYRVRKKLRGATQSNMRKPR